MDIEQQRKIKLAFGVEKSKRLFRLRLARYKALAEAVADYLKEKERETRQFALLDVGVGSGRSMRYIEAQGVADRISFYGLDNSPHRLSGLYRSEQWQLTQANAEKEIPYESALFDIVLCEQVLEHLVNPAAAIDEIARVLRPDGLLVLGVPIFPLGISHLRKLLVGVSGRRLGVSRSHLQSFDCMAIKSLLCAQNRFTIRKSYGFRIVSGGVFAALEDFLWWYRFNRWLGRAVPSLCTEIQIVALRNTTP
jgi:SAM-dependent methyltransferase